MLCSRSTAHVFDFRSQFPIFFRIFSDLLYFCEVPNIWLLMSIYAGTLSRQHKFSRNTLKLKFDFPNLILQRAEFVVDGDTESSPKVTQSDLSNNLIMKVWAFWNNFSGVGGRLLNFSGIFWYFLEFFEITKKFRKKCNFPYRTVTCMRKFRLHPSLMHGQETTL